MTSSADTSRGPGYAAPGYAESGANSATDAAPAKAAQPGVRDGRVIFYVLLSLIALAPGLAGWLYGVVGKGTVIGVWHDWMIKELQDIKFGSGARFWMGVAGAAMMGVMLLYPVRKWLVQRFRAGGVGIWFHIHIILGLLGPVLILYHCYFGFGGFNANVALITMLVVVVSGIAGQFVYQRVSAGFYGDKQQARAHLDAVIDQLRAAKGVDGLKEALIERLEAFEAQLLTPRRGVIASLLGSLRVEVRRRQFFRDAGAVLGGLRHTNGWTAEQYAQLRQLIGGHLGAYVSTARRAAGRSIREQLWARWRLFHLPLFLIMTVAAVLHVVAVWDMDGPTVDRAAVEPPVEQEAQPQGQATPPAAAKEAPALPRAGGIIEQKVRKTVRIESAPGAATLSTELAQGAQPVEPPGGKPDAVAALLDADDQQETPAERQSVPEPQAASDKATREAKPVLVDKPKPAARPPVVAKKPDDAYRPPVAVHEAAPAASVAATPAKPAAAKSEPVKVAEAPAAKPAPAATRVAEAKPADPLYAELAKRTEEQPMGLGAAKGTTLAERIASLKAQRFDHSKTKFPLTGRHTKVACEDCHKKSLENTPTACIACHKKDDVHRGRRPDCARCHTTNNWGQIRRR